MPEAKPINPLTSLRFFAAMWVVLYHYWPISPAGALHAGLVAKGYLGVELLHSCSRRLHPLPRLSRQPRRRADELAYGGFLWARLARIYPLHLVTLIGVGVMALAAGAAGHVFDSNVLSWPSLPANLLLVQAWGLAPQAAWNHPSWSISAEWFAYLIFPLFAWAALKSAPGGLAVAALKSFAALVVDSTPAFQQLAGFSL